MPLPHLPALLRPLPLALLPIAFLPILFLLAVLAAAPSGAVQPDEMLADPAQEARAREIGRELRCLVCQNESIDESNADLARDLRRLVRERLQQGDSNQQVLDYVVSRYGDFVLLRPPLKPATWALWFGPPVILLFGGIALLLYFRGRARTARPGGAGDRPLDPVEQEQLSRLLAILGDAAGHAPASGNAATPLPAGQTEERQP